MSTAGTQTDTVPSMLDAALLKKSADGQPVYVRTLPTLNDTADPVALIRNALSAQVDRNAAVVLAGRPTNLVALTALPEARAWAARKASVLAIAAGRFDGGAPDPVVRADVAGFRKLLSDWPGPIVMAGAELSDALPFPGASVDTGFTWAPNHPVVDAYRAFKPMPYDAPSRALAATLHAASPAERYFDLSEPGTITVADDGRTRFTPSPAGTHRYLIARPDQKERVLQAYVQLVSAEPPPRPGRVRRDGRDGSGADADRRACSRLSPVGMSEQRLIGQTDDFNAAVRPVLAETCAQCHNSRLLSGGLNVEDDRVCRSRSFSSATCGRRCCGAFEPATCRRPARRGRRRRSSTR